MIVKQIKHFLFITYHRYYWKKKCKDISLGLNTLVYKTCKLSPNVSIGPNSILSNSSISSYSYLGANCRIHYTSIGKFCSIGSDVKIGLSNHPTQIFVSTSPYFYLPILNGTATFTDKQYYNPIKHISIGNDVWIGANVLIADGVNIGDGAVIAAGAVVTKNVDPYTIVGGVPAKTIKKRFLEHEIDNLLTLKWWDKDINWIKANAAKFRNIQEFLNTND